MKMSKAWKRRRLLLLVAALLGVGLYAFSDSILRRVGGFLILHHDPLRAEAVVVLNTDLEYYPRLIEAARLYRLGLTEKVVINGNRKTDVLRKIESKGFTKCCPWYADSLRILELFGVPRGKVIPMSVEDAYDTVSEAEALGAELIGMRFTNVIIITSKFHSRRAYHIWKKMFGERISIRMLPAREDPFSPDKWWKEGRQVRWVLSEYGAWLYYWWKELT